MKLPAIQLLIGKLFGDSLLWKKQRRHIIHLKIFQEMLPWQELLLNVLFVKNRRTLYGMLQLLLLFLLIRLLIIFYPTPHTNEHSLKFATCTGWVWFCWSPAQSGLMTVSTKAEPNSNGTWHFLSKPIKWSILYSIVNWVYSSQVKTQEPKFCLDVHFWGYNFLKV